MSYIFFVIIRLDVLDGWGVFKLLFGIMLNFFFLGVILNMEEVNKIKLSIYNIC